VAAVAHSSDGRSHAMDPVDYLVDPPAERFTDVGGRAAELRRRSARWTAVAPSQSRDLRVLGFTHMLVHGGAPLWQFEVLARLAAVDGFSCEIVSLQDGPLRHEFERAGVPVHLTDHFPVGSIERYEGHMAELSAWAAGRFDAVVVNTLGSFAGADLATRLGIPALWAVHESFTLPMFWATVYPGDALHRYVRERAELALREAAAVVFEAEATRRLFLGDADPRRLVTMPYGIELDAIAAARETRTREELRRGFGIDPDATVVLCLGSVEPRKSQAMLAQAFAQVAERHPRAQLVIVGATDLAYCADYTAALRAFVGRAGLESRVRIEPVTRDPYAWQVAADVLVCASDIESLPRVILEAMAFERPVLSTRVFGVPELIEDGRTGYLCDMRDVADLARGLDRVLGADPADLRAVAVAAAEHVRRRHDPDAYFRDFVGLLEGVVRGGGLRRVVDAATS
jgi:D-inositol-3-phosphate glycosyltransferase